MSEAREGQSRLLRVFLCHSSGDKPAVRDLYRRLRDDGFEPWLDEEALLPGQDWKEEIPQAVRGSDVIIVCISRASVGKEGYLQKELRDALSVAEEKPEGTIFIIPVRLEEVEVPRRLSQWQWADLFQTGGYQRLVQALNVSSAKLAKRLGTFPTSGGLREENVDLREREILPTSRRDVEQRQATESKRPNTQEVMARPELGQQGEVDESLESQLSGEYDVIRRVYKGNYSAVFKCVARTSGELCVVKRTIANHVNLKALEAIQKVSSTNLAKPRRIWEQAGGVFEELPYVGGVRLSHAVARGIGGLTGSVLASFCTQIENTLSNLHESQIIHRDLHPDNIYMVIWRPNSGSSPPWKGHGFHDFLLAWVIVDNTFATLVSESSKARLSHSPYTPEEQVTTGAVPASDLYAYGATLYFGITGNEIPSFQTRKLDPKSLSDFPHGWHHSSDFPAYLRGLLSLDPSKRPNLSRWLPEASVPELYTGTLRISKTTLLAINTFAQETRLLEGVDALRFYRGLRDSLRSAPRAEKKLREAEYWTNELQAAGI